MKLDEIKKEKGTYAGLRFTPESVELIQKYLRDNKIPKPTDIKKLHVTLLFSRKFLPDYEAAGKLDTTYKCVPDGFDVWKTKPPGKDDESWNALVLKFKAPDVVKRHKELMDEHKATFDHPTYNPHITLSYNIGDMDKSELPEFTETLELDEEYKEQLDLDWAANKGVVRGHRKKQNRNE